MYIPSREIDKTIFYQGDVIKNFPFFVLSELEEKVAAIKEAGEGTIEIKSKLVDVMILSQTCDIQRRDQVIVAPIASMASGVESGELKANILDNIRGRKINFLFYLPESPDLIPESYCNLQLIYYVSPALLNSFADNKAVTLSDWGRHHLSWALSNYFGRPIISKVRD